MFMVWEAGELEHFRKYEELAQQLGVRELIRLLPFDKDRLCRETLTGNNSFNRMGDMPISKTGPFQRRFGGGTFSLWDAPHDAVQALAAKIETRKTSLSLSETVCVLKHVGRYYVAGVPGPDGPVTLGRTGVDEWAPDLASQKPHKIEETSMEYEEKLISIDDFIKRFGLTTEVERLANRSDPADDKDWAKTASHWRITIHDGECEVPFVTEYSMGSACKGEPKLRDVLDSLCSDVIPDGTTFEEWASDLGIDPDSRRGERIYRACQASTKKLRELLGTEAFDLLVSGVERL